MMTFFEEIFCKLVGVRFYVRKQNRKKIMIDVCVFTCFDSAFSVILITGIVCVRCTLCTFYIIAGFIDIDSNQIAVKTG